MLGPVKLNIGRAILGLADLTKLFTWKPSLGCRLFVIPIEDVRAARTYELDPFWVWHFVNAFEERGGPSIDFCRSSRFVIDDVDLVLEDGEAPLLTRLHLDLVFDPESETSYLAILDGQRLEEGPVAKAHFDQTIPLTFHGVFAANKTRFLRPSGEREKAETPAIPPKRRDSRVAHFKPPRLFSALQGKLDLANDVSTRKASLTQFRAAYPASRRPVAGRRDRSPPPRVPRLPASDDHHSRNQVGSRRPPESRRTAPNHPFSAPTAPKHASDARFQPLNPP